MGKGWTAAGDLIIGDAFYALSGDVGVVTDLTLEELVAPILVYDLDVADFDTYFVGDGVLVHNACVIESGPYKAIVNESNELEFPHAHITKNGRRVAKFYADGLIKSLKDRGAGKFINKFKETILEGIEEYYPPSIR